METIKELQTCKILEHCSRWHQPERANFLEKPPLSLNYYACVTYRKNNSTRCVWMKVPRKIKHRWEQRTLTGNERDRALPSLQTTARRKVLRHSSENMPAPWRPAQASTELWVTERTDRQPPPLPLSPTTDSARTSSMLGLETNRSAERQAPPASSKHAANHILHYWSTHTR